jgi:hypothetical protein
MMEFMYYVGGFSAFCCILGIVYCALKLYDLDFFNSVDIGKLPLNIEDLKPGDKLYIFLNDSKKISRIAAHDILKKELLIDVCMNNSYCVTENYSNKSTLRYLKYYKDFNLKNK